MGSTDGSSASDGDMEGGNPSDFQAFVLSLASSGMLHLGLIPDPDTGEPNANVPMARHTIDLLSMLAVKTEGNLSDDEQRTLKGLLHELRIQYVAITRGAPQDDA